MQRYRVNYKLLVGLVIGGLATAGASYGLWWWQVDSNANTLRDRAENQVQDGERRDALLTLEQYVALRPEDAQALIDFGHLAAEIGSDFLDRDFSGNDVRTATYVLTDAVTKTEIWKNDVDRSAAEREEIAVENAKLRRELVDNYLLSGQPHKALPHVEALIKENGGPNSETDAELIGLQLQCLENAELQEKALELSREYIGFNASTREFDDAAAVAPQIPDAYWAVALDLWRKGIDTDKEAARGVIEKMVLVNPSPHKHGFGNTSSY